MPDTDDYLALIPAMNAGAPKFRATLEALLRQPTENQDAIYGLIVALSLDAAIGVQLDYVGEWVGRSRYVSTPLPNVYFSFDIASLGFDEAVWKGPYDPIEGLTRLDDPTYRLLLRAKIAANHWDGTVPGARAALRIMFTEALSTSGTIITAEDGTIITAEDGTIITADPEGFQGFYVEDRFDMSMVFGMSGILPNPVFISLFAGGYIPLKPAGVRVYYFFTSVNGTPIFGLDVSNGYLAGFDEGSWGVSDLELLTA